MSVAQRLRYKFIYLFLFKQKKDEKPIGLSSFFLIIVDYMS